MLPRSTLLTVREVHKALLFVRTVFPEGNPENKRRINSTTRGDKSHNTQYHGNPNYWGDPIFKVYGMSVWRSGLARHGA